MNELAVKVALLKAGIKTGISEETIEHCIAWLADKYGTEAVGEEWVHPTI